MQFERRWVAACLVAGLLGCAPFVLGGILRSFEVLGVSVLTVIEVVLVPALLTAPRLALIAEESEQDEEGVLRGSFLVSVRCAIFAAVIGVLLDFLAPAQLWIDWIWVPISVSTLLLSSPLVAWGLRRSWFSTLVIGAFSVVGLIYGVNTALSQFAITA